MFDLSNILQRRNMFGPNPTPPPNPFQGVDFGGQEQNQPEVPQDTLPPQPSLPPNPDPYQGRNFADIYGKIMDAEPGPATKRYRDFISQEEPKQENYKPGKGAKAVAMLAGVSAGAEHGGGAAINAVQDVLNTPYNNALASYKLRADRYAKGADEEQKDNSNRVKTFRDILSDDRLQQAEKDRATHNTAQEGHWTRQDDIAEKNAQSRGFNFATRATDGHRIGTKVNPNAPGGFETLDLGKYDKSIDEKTTDKKDFSKFESGVTLGRQKNFFDFSDPKIQNREIAVSDHKNAEVDKRAENRNNNRQNTPRAELEQKSAAYRNIINEHPELKNDIDLNTLTHRNDTVIGPLLKAAMAKYKTPAKDNKLPDPAGIR